MFDFGMKDTIWGISAKWATKKINCTSEKIAVGCQGNCCKGNTFYPSKANGDRGQCFYLLKTGCILQPKDKPIICLLFPFKLNKNLKLVLYGRAMMPHGCCHKNIDDDSKIILEAIKENFYELFGKEQTDEAIDFVKRGKDYNFIIPSNISNQYKKELTWEKEDMIPTRRSQCLT